MSTGARPVTWIEANQRELTAAIAAVRAAVERLAGNDGAPATPAVAPRQFEGAAGQASRGLA